MDENRLKTIIEEVVYKAVDLIKKDIEGIKVDLSSVKQDLAGVKDTQGDHTRRLEALSGDMEQVLSEMKVRMMK